MAGKELTSDCETASTMLFSNARKMDLAVSGEKAEKSRKVWTVRPPLISRIPSERKGASAAPNLYCAAGDKSEGIDTYARWTASMSAVCSASSVVMKGSAHLDDRHRRRLAKHVKEGDKDPVVYSNL